VIILSNYSICELLERCKQENDVEEKCRVAFNSLSLAFFVGSVLINMQEIDRHIWEGTFRNSKHMFHYHIK